MTRTIRIIVLAAAMLAASIAAGWHWSSAAAAYPNPFVNVCYANDADHQALETPEAVAAGQWTWTTITKTTRAYYRNLGWEVYTTFSPYTNGSPGFGDRSYRCPQVFDGTVPFAQSGWDGVIDP